jgi:hypothetical protein
MQLTGVNSDWLLSISLKHVFGQASQCPQLCGSKMRRPRCWLGTLVWAASYVSFGYDSKVLKGRSKLIKFYGCSVHWIGASTC